MIAERDGL